MAFPVAAFAEEWEYGDDDELFLDEDELEDIIAGKASEREWQKEKDRTGRGAVGSHVGVLERKANVTKIGGDVVISKEGTGDVKVSLVKVECNATS